MIAAIYVRKSTEQNGVADEQKSVTRQIEHARQYATRKGWLLADDHVYVDDGISGAEFANRPGFLRLMNALKPRPTFQVLIMSEESRLGREAIETAYALKQLVQAGVRVFFYLEDRERTLDSPTDKIMLSLTTFADELEREKARQRTYDAMQRKAKAGHVTGGRVFGYDNLEIVGANGQRSHVERRINDAEAAVIRQIFERSAAGAGLTRIAKELNAAGALNPRPQQGRPAGWAPSTVREVLLRPLYRGEIVWNQSRKRDTWGRAQRSERPEDAWLHVPAPELRIVSPDLCAASQRERSKREAQYSMGERSYRASSYLLSGFAADADDEDQDGDHSSWVVSVHLDRQHNRWCRLALGGPNDSDGSGPRSGHGRGRVAPNGDTHHRTAGQRGAGFQHRIDARTSDVGDAHDGCTHGSGTGPQASRGKDRGPVLVRTHHRSGSCPARRE